MVKFKMTSFPKAAAKCPPAIAPASSCPPPGLRHGQSNLQTSSPPQHAVPILKAVRQRFPAAVSGLGWNSNAFFRRPAQPRQAASAKIMRTLSSDSPHCRTINRLVLVQASELKKQLRENHPFILRMGGDGHPRIKLCRVNESDRGRSHKSPRTGFPSRRCERKKSAANENPSK